MHPVIPVYPSAAGLARSGLVGAKWRGWFPFYAHSAAWTFSGRVALYHGLPSLKLPPHSTILVPAYHQGVEIDALLASGYRLRYYRLNEQLCIDLEDVERRLDKTVSVLYVTHYFGAAQPLEPIRAFCEAHRLRLIEDCALSLFSRDNGTWLGSVGDLALFSVYKTLPLPHGGFLVTKQPHPPVRLRRAPWHSTFAQTLDLIQHGMRLGGWAQLEGWVRGTAGWIGRRIHWTPNQTIGSGGATWDARLLEYGASSWTVWLMHLTDPEQVVARRRANFLRLASRLRGHLCVPFPELRPGTCPLFFPILVPDKVRFQKDLAELGVQSVNLWDASHPTCPAELAEEVSGWRRHCLELPVHQELTAGEIERVADAVLAALAKSDGAGSPAATTASGWKL
jgi:dTDP-4-amino-4,6-dideoxygalactose transaminase